MKKMLSVLLAAAMTVSAMSVSAFAEVINTSDYNKPVYALGSDLSLYAKGDVNMDGEIDTKDASILLTDYCCTQILDIPEGVLNDAQRALANVYDEEDDRGLDTLDASLILTYCSGKIIEIDGIEDMTVKEFWNYKKALGNDGQSGTGFTRTTYYDHSFVDDIPDGVARGIYDGYNEDGEPIFRTDERGNYLLVDHYVYHPETDEYEYFYLTPAPVYELEGYSAPNVKSVVYCLGITSDGDVIYRKQNGQYACRKASDWFDYVDGKWVEK